MGMGGVQRIVKFVRYLPEYGWNAKVVTVKPTIYYAYDPELLSEIPKEAIICTESLDPLRVAAWLMRNQRDSSKNITKENKLFHWMNPWLAFPDSKIGWIPFAYRQAKKIIRDCNTPVIITTSPPLSSHLAGLWLKKKYPVRWIADFRDYWIPPYSETLPTGFHTRFHKKLRQKILRTADKVTVVSSDIKNQFCRDNLISLDKCVVITNGFDPADYPETFPFDENKFRIVHMGTLNAINDPRSFLKALEQVIQREPDFLKNAQFIQIGKWFNKNQMLTNCGTEIKEIIVDVGYLSHREALKIFCGGDLLLFVLGEQCPIGWISGRLFEYLPLVQPILGIIPEGEAAQLIRNYNRGIIISPGNVKEIAEAIVHYYKLWLSGSYTKKGLSYTDSTPRELEIYTRKHLTGQLANIMNSTEEEKELKIV